MATPRVLTERGRRFSSHSLKVVLLVCAIKAPGVLTALLETGVPNRMGRDHSVLSSSSDPPLAAYYNQVTSFAPMKHAPIPTDTRARLNNW